jgi:hypothetical protein
MLVVLSATSLLSELAKLGEGFGSPFFLILL